jgi:nitrate/TMAO reductase-like tetraheme cytochrome c subunit
MTNRANAGRCKLHRVAQNEVVICRRCHNQRVKALLDEIRSLKEIINGKSRGQEAGCQDQQVGVFTSTEAAQGDKSDGSD